MRDIAILALLICALAFAGCSLFDGSGATAPAIAGGPTSISGAPRSATAAWTTPAPTGYPAARAQAIPGAPRLPTAPPLALGAPTWSPPAPAPAPAPAVAPAPVPEDGAGKG